MTLSAKFFKLHRWFGYAVALQVLAWVLGGLLFAWLPFKAWVKGEAAVQRVVQPLPADWAQRLAAAAPPGDAGPVLSVQSVATAMGPALKLKLRRGEQWLSANGGELPPADALAVAAYAQALYRGEGTLAGVRRLPTVAPRLGIVKELGAKDPWLAQFDDGLKTRLYFHGRSGELLAVRNEAWVLYDFFWRLHVMDYSDGEDFNNLLLRVASPLALVLVLTGLVMSALALARAVRRRRAHREQARSEAD